MNTLTGTQRTRMMIALDAARDYCLLANSAPSDERADYDKLILNRLKHAVENAGFEMVEKKPASKAA